MFVSKFSCIVVNCQGDDERNSTRLLCWPHHSGMDTPRRFASRTVPSDVCIDRDGCGASVSRDASDVEQSDESCEQWETRLESVAGVQNEERNEALVVVLRRSPLKFKRLFYRTSVIT